MFEKMAMSSGLSLLVHETSYFFSRKPASQQQKVNRVQEISFNNTIGLNLPVAYLVNPFNTYDNVISLSVW